MPRRWLEVARLFVCVVTGAAVQSPVPTSGAGFQGHGKLGSKITIVVGSQGFGAILGYAALLAIGRYYAPDAYGAYLFALSFIGLISTLFHLGFSRAHQREVSAGIPIEAAMGVFVRIRGVLMLGMIGMVLLVLAALYGPINRPFTDATTLTVIWIILASSILSQVRHIASDTWTAQGKVNRTELCNAVDTVVWALVVVGLGLGSGAASGRWVPLPALADWVASQANLGVTPTIATMAVFVALGHFAGKVAALLMAVTWWSRDRVRIGPWNPALARQYRDFAFPVALTSMLLIVLQHTDVLMLGFFWSTHQVGLYGAAQKLANVALLANIAIRSLLMPYFSSLMRNGENVRAMVAFRQIERFLLLGVIPLALGMAIWAEQGIHIFVGDGFLGAAAALKWLAAWTLISAMNMPMRAKHMAAGHTQLLLRAALIGVSLNLILNAVLIPRTLFGFTTAGMGAEGAALATFVASLVGYVHHRYYGRKLFDVPWMDSAQVRMFVAGLAPGLVWWALSIRLPPSATDRVWELAGIGLLGALAYALALWMVKGMRQEDVALVRSALSPRGVVKEFRGRP